MREYKFRGKRLDNGEWVYGHLFHGKNEQGKEEAFIVSKNYNCHGGIIDLDTCASWAVEAETIGQYIGLYDKNGKEIYEGDIVKIPDNYKEYGVTAGETYKIYFAFGGFRLKPKYNLGARGYWLENNNEVEVIGNTTDNSELLEEVQNEQ